MRMIQEEVQMFDRVVRFFVQELRAEMPGVKISYYSEVCGSRLLV